MSAPMDPNWAKASSASPEPPKPPLKAKTGWAGFARMGGVGDDLMCGVVAPGLKKKYGKVEVITQLPQGCVFDNNPWIDKISFTEPKWLPQSDNKAWQSWFEGRSQEYDFFEHLSHSCETLRALVPGQTQFWWPASFRRKMCGQSYLETILDICELPYEFEPLFYPTDEEKEKALETKKKVGERCIVWVISGTRLDKCHPLANIIIARLVREVAPVVMLGAPGKDFGMAQAIQKDVINHNGSDVGLHLGLSPDPNAPTWPIRRVCTFAHTAGDVVVGPDTGPMWATAFEKVCKVMMLSHASEENITKHWVNTISLHADQKRVPCFPCHQLHDEPRTCTPNCDMTGAACISDISVDAVINAVKQGLAAA